MKKAARRCELAAGLGMLTVGFLQACSLSFDRPVISFFLWPTLALAAFALVYRARRLRHYMRSRGFWLLCAFCVSFGVSILLNLRYGWYENVRTLVFQGIFFFLIYCWADDEPAARTWRRDDILIRYYVAGCALLSLMSFAVLGRDEAIVPEVGPTYYIGFHMGRLFGVYWDANIGAVMNAVSAALCLGLFRRKRGFLRRGLLLLLIALDVLYISFSDSRTGRIALAVGVTVFAFLELRQRGKRGWLLPLLLAAAASALLPIGVRYAYNAWVTATDAREAEVRADAAEAPRDGGEVMLMLSARAGEPEYLETPEILSVESTPWGLEVRWNPVPGAVWYRVYRQAGDGEWERFITTEETSVTDVYVEDGVAYSYVVRCLSEDWESFISEESAVAGARFKVDATIGRRSEVERTDISNRRFDIWKSALEIFKLRPVFGVGRGSLLPFVEAELPDSYLVTNDHLNFESMHNTFLDVLAGQGLVGLAIYLGMGAYFLAVLLKNRETIARRTGAMGRAGTAAAAAVTASAFLMSEIVYTASPMTLIFWMSLGELMRAADEEDGHG